MLLILLVLVLVVALIASGRLLARDVGFVVPFAFIATYVFGLGALILLNVGAFDMVDPKFREEWLTTWLVIYWPLWTILFAPSAICALLATWFSRATEPRDAAIMLGVYVVLILVAIEIEWVFDPYIIRGRYGFWMYLLGAFAILSAIFLAIAQVARVRRANEPQRHQET